MLRSVMVWNGVFSVSSEKLARKTSLCFLRHPVGEFPLLSIYVINAINSSKQFKFAIGKYFYALETFSWLNAVLKKLLGR